MKGCGLSRRGEEGVVFRNVSEGPSQTSSDVVGGAGKRGLKLSPGPVSWTCTWLMASPSWSEERRAMLMGAADFCLVFVPTNRESGFWGWECIPWDLFGGTREESREYFFSSPIKTMYLQ